MEINSDKKYSWGRKAYLIPVVLTILFGILFSLVSLPNHYFFRTATLDLGLYTNALYDYAHFRFNDSTTFKEYPVNLLADHFDLFLMLLSPLSWIFREWTLLIVQIVVLITGAWGVYVFFKDRGLSLLMARLAMLFFLLHFSLFSALSFDYHSNVIAAAMLPWFFVFVQRENLLKSVLVLFLIIICKENMSLWMFFICIALIWMYRKSAFRKHLIWMGVFSLLWFLIVTIVVMPSFNEDQSLTQFKYSILGKDYAQAMRTLFTHPFLIIKTLFINHSSSTLGDGVKQEAWLFFLFSGGILLLFRPVWIVMLIPVFMQKFLHDSIQTWGINDQYAIEFAPVIALGSFDVINRISSGKRKIYLSTILLLMTTGTTIRLMDRTSARVPKTNIRIYQAAHWKSKLSGQDVRHALSLIPANAHVCAQNNLLAQLAWRDQARMFPLTADADYVLLAPDENPYPLSEKEFVQRLDELLENTETWELIYTSEDLKLFKNKRNNSHN